MRTLVITLSALAIAGCSAPPRESTEEIGTLTEARFLLWQPNSAGEDLHIFDAETGALLRKLEVGPQPHGIAATADQRTIVIALEANSRAQGELVWIDAVSFNISRRATICREPHALAITPDGAWIYIPCRDGHYWVVEGATGNVVRRIETGGRPHNTQISRDGRWAFLSPMGPPHAVTIVDIEGEHQIAGEIVFAGAVRPSALSADGRWFLQQVDGLNGFQAADVGARVVAATVEHATPLDGIVQVGALGRLGLGGFERCHGLSIRPDQSEVWSVCGDTLTIHAFEPESFPERASIALPAKGYWITFSPDSRFAYVALADSGEVAVIDAAARRVLMQLQAGEAPKRNIVLRRVAP